MSEEPGISIELVPIEKIAVLNPRGRGRRVHREIIDNIEAVGLKRPITVSRRKLADGGERYDLICGEGRIEAFQALGESQIPAIIVDLPEEECFVRSLVENVARPQHRGVDLMREVGALRKRGYSDAEVAQKIGVTPSWVSLIVGLLEKGEERLIAAVDNGVIPLTLAATIARSDDAGIQQALADAYADGKIKGKNVELVRRLLERRRRGGGFGNQRFGRTSNRSRPTPEQLVQIFRKEADRQRLIAKKADFVQSRLLFIVQALKELRQDRDFGNLLRAEQLDTMPRALDARLSGAAL
ncbi:MAG: ParB N-terminal domain-containing protein [Phenylobacterium sp.]|uniref:plasmid partitioning protein RepB C-terminal domain-containing protein n=1 Tax=Phenylobacterium sp. TaxID=1871053 RepID=UPI001B6B9FE6|nr:plasmid partitioning protein RepB C-terminal domain-containing protein [Phenylobacterium sp.]MBP7818060.1 ParB N-terminal domain-containing protein [Phenylobacterium sp.]MBP9753788.1 ParB N-terminal domain-containing protein [Phenylobacterium sp.]